MFKRIRKILGWTFFVVIVLLVLTAFLLTQEKVQTQLAKEAAEYFSKKLDTKVSIDKVRIDFLKYVHLENLYIEDHQKDTLAYIGDLRIKSSSLVADLWNDKTSIIKDVKLTGGVVNLLRGEKSDRWNYTFVEETFATDDKDSSASDPLNLDLKKIAFEQIRFKMLDAWAGQDIRSNIGKLAVNFDIVDIPSLLFRIRDVKIENTNFAFEDYKGSKPKVAKRTRDRTKWGSPFNPNGLVLSLKDLNLENVNFEYRKNKHISIPGRFDEKHIIAKNIQLKLTDLKLHKDTLNAEILSLNTQERSGVAIQELKASVKLNQQLAELSDLYLKTNHSIVRDYYSMRYDNFHDFNSYISNVSMYANFKNSIIDKRDIEFFSGKVRQLPSVTKLIGKGEGTVDNLFIPQINLSAPNILYNGSARITGLPDINNTFFEINADRLLTTGNELIHTVPELKTDAVKWGKLSKIDFSGKFSGGIKKFNADGLLVTNQGNTEVDMFMNLNGAQPIYKGYVKTNQLQLGKILGRNDIGAISMLGTIAGSGFDFEHLNSKVDAQVNQVTFDGTRYQNINLNGFFKDRRFNGLAKSRDEKLGFDFEGDIDFSTKNPNYDFKSDIIKVNLKTLGITPQDAFLKARVNLDFKGRTIDDFVGKAILHDVVLKYDKEILSVPRIRLNSYHTDSLGKVLDLKSSVADARVEGQYSLKSIDKVVRSFLHYYIPTFIAPETLPENEIFKFNVLVKNANKVINIFEPNLKIDSGAIIKGDISTPNQLLNFTGLLPNVTYNGIKFNQVGIQSKGTPSAFKTEILASSFFTGESEIAKDVNLQVSMSNDTAHFNLKTNPIDEFLGQAELDGRATALVDRVQVNINPSTFIVKDDKYRLFSFFPIEYSYDGVLLAKDVLIKNGNQQLTFNATHSGVTNDAVIVAENVDLEKISSYLDAKNLVIRGRVNTTVSATDLWGNTDLQGSLITVEDLRLNTDTLGIANIDFSYLKESNVLKIKESSKLENGLTHFYPKGSINFDKNTLDVSADMQNTPISFVNQYVNDLVDSLKGNATGIVHVKGDMNNPNILGDVIVNDVGAKLIFTGCSYSMNKVKVKLNKEEISFAPITIYDERPQPGTALLTGSIKHTNYATYDLDLNVSSKDLLGLNTDEVTGDLFYGKINSALDMDITGALDNITMSLKAKPLKGSEFYLPLKSSGDASSYDFISFRSLGKFQEQNEKKKKGTSYFKVKMDIEATPDVLASIILDPNTRERIEARGYGNISLDVDLGNEINMYNTFTVEEGIYKFNFKGLLPRDFDLEKGGTITWNGDAYKANLNMKAIYKTKIPLYPLISVEAGQDNSSIDSKQIAIAKREEETHVIVNLRGALSKPDIKFDIQQPYNNAIGSYALEKLEGIRRTRDKDDQKELVYQSGMILLINSFRPPGGDLNTRTVANSTTESTISDILGSAFSPILNSFVNKLGLKNLTVDVGFKNYTTDITSGNTLAERRQVNLGLNYSFNRFLISFGNSLDFANANAIQAGANSLTYNGDFRGSYLLTLDGRYRVNAFTVTNYDYVDNRPETRGGIGLSYKKSFNKWKGLFKRANRTKNSVLDIPVQTGEMKKEEEPSVTMALEILSKTSF